MTTPDPKLAARLARLKDLFDCAMRASDTDARECTLKKAIYLSELDVAYRSNQLITTAEADARVEAAVVAEREAILAEIGIMVGVETAGFVSARDGDDEASAISHGNALLALNDVRAAIRSRGVTG